MIYDSRAKIQKSMVRDIKRERMVQSPTSRTIHISFVKRSPYRGFRLSIALKLVHIGDCTLPSNRVGNLTTS